MKIEERIKKIRLEREKLERAKQTEDNPMKFYPYPAQGDVKIVEEVNLFGRKNIKVDIKLESYSKKECLEKELALKLDFDFKEDYLSETDFKDKLKQIFDAEYYRIEVNKKYAASGNPQQCKPAVFIQAPTGVGKTKLMCELLMDYKEGNHDKKPLYLVNRTALRIQIKKELLEYDKRLSALCKKDKSVDFDVLDYNDEVAGIEVITYHKFLYKKASEYDNYSIIVADEAHFFCSDALFCPDTSNILHKICNNFYKIPRIYITATDSEVFETIAKYENYSMLDCSKNCEFLGTKDEILAKKNRALGFRSDKSIINYYNAKKYLENNMPYNNMINENVEPHLALKFFYYSLESYNKNYRLYPIEYETKDDSIKKIVCGTKKGKKTIIFVDSKKYGEELKKDLDKLSKENSEENSAEKNKDYLH